MSAAAAAHLCFAALAAASLEALASSASLSAWGVGWGYIMPGDERREGGVARALKWLGTRRQAPANCERTQC